MVHISLSECGLLGVLVIGGARGARPGRPIVKGVRGQGSVRMTNAPTGCH